MTNIDYDAKGQRLRLDYGSGVSISYAYNPLTFRLTRLQTLRVAERLQDLAYTYDPVGNITHIHDGGQQTLYFNNQVVTPHADYTYDALYRLISAEGREHIGQAMQPETTWNDAFRVRLQHPQDGQAMRRYTEHYQYDPVGNFLQVIHQATNGNWTRSYTYNEVSLTEKSKHSNRLSSTVVGSGTPEMYPYDAHGNMMAMAHLPGMKWDFRDQLRQMDLAGGGDAYYVYDGGGQRVRKVVERNGGALIEERLYLGGFEIFRRRDAAGTVTLERETLHIIDGQQRIALVETRTHGSEPGVPSQLVRYQFGNHLGSAALELDEAGQIISYEEYYPYGSTSYQAGRSAAEVSLKRYRHTGKERDEETGFAYYGFRYYAFVLGRWTSTDPLSLQDGSNLYCFMRANPVSLVDLVGTDSKPTQQLSPELVEKFKEVVETRHWLNNVNIIQGGRDPIAKNYVHLFFNLAMAGDESCSTKISSEKYFDEGAQKFAEIFKLQKEYQYAVSQGLRRRIDMEYEGSENSLQANSKGGNFTNRTSREAAERYVNRHRNPERVIKTAEVGAMVLAPEYYFTARSIYHSAHGNPKEAALDLTGVLAGRVVRAAASETRAASRGSTHTSSGGQGAREVTAPGGPGFVAPTQVTAASQMGWQSIGTLSAAEAKLVSAVTAAPQVLAGRSLNIAGRGMFTLDQYLIDNGIKWTQRWQDVYNHALYMRTAGGQPVHVLAGGGYTAGEVVAAEAGAKKGGIANVPWWP